MLILLQEKENLLFYPKKEIKMQTYRDLPLYKKEIEKFILISVGFSQWINHNKDRISKHLGISNMEIDNMTIIELKDRLIKSL